MQSQMRTLADGLEFPEGPVVLPDGSVVIVELRAERVTRIWPDGRKEIVAEVKGGPNGLAMGPGGRLYLCNNGGFQWSRKGSDWFTLASDSYSPGLVQRIDIQSGTVETWLTSLENKHLKGPNDLVFDCFGGLWFTDHGKKRAQTHDYGSVCYMPAGTREAREVLYPMQPTNGIGLSPDEQTLYVAETPTARLWKFSIKSAGTITPTAVPQFRHEKGTCITGANGYQMFDSMAIEACGNICQATLISGCITVIDPSGKIIDTFATGDKSTTNIAFGGPELRTAYITLSDSGKVVSVDWPRPGLPLNFLNK